MHRRSPEPLTYTELWTLIEEGWAEDRDFWSVSCVVEVGEPDVRLPSGRRNVSRLFRLKADSQTEFARVWADCIMKVLDPAAAPKPAGTVYRFVLLPEECGAPFLIPSVRNHTLSITTHTPCSTMEDHTYISTEYPHYRTEWKKGETTVTGKLEIDKFCTMRVSFKGGAGSGPSGVHATAAEIEENRIPHLSLMCKRFITEEQWRRVNEAKREMETPRFLSLIPEYIELDHIVLAVDMVKFAEYAIKRVHKRFFLYE